MSQIHLLQSYSNQTQYGTGVKTDIDERNTMLLNWRINIVKMNTIWPKAIYKFKESCIKFSSVQSLSHVWLFATLWTVTARPPCPSPTPRVHSNSCPLSRWCHPGHLILCQPLLLLPPIPPSIRAFSNESTLHMRWPKYWSFSFSISPSNEHPGLISFTNSIFHRTRTKEI